MALPFGKRIAFSAIATGISILVIGIVAEIFLRIRYENIAQITGVTEWQISERGLLTYRWDQYHPRYGWTNRPGYRSDDHLPFRLTINEHGLRGERDSLPNPAPGIQRILLFGDSLAFGEDVDDVETVDTYLEGSLANTEVLNFGVHGYGLGQMMLRLEDEAFALNPDHILLMVMLPRNLSRDQMSHFVHAKPVFGLRDGKLLVSNVPVPTASRLPWLYRHCFVAALLFGPAAEEFTVDDARPDIRVEQKLLQRIRERAEREGVPLTLVSVSNAYDLLRLGSQPGERTALGAIRDALALPELDVLDLIDFLEARVAEEGRMLATTSWHWSPRGNCLISQQIADHLSQADSPWVRQPDAPACPLTQRRQ